MTIVDVRSSNLSFRNGAPVDWTMWQASISIDGDDNPEYTTWDTVVYFALDRDACQIKIGWSGNLDRRIDDLRRARPSLELLGSLDGGYDLERAMHGRFRDYRCEGREWYTSEIAADVLRLLRV